MKKVLFILSVLLINNAMVHAEKDSSPLDVFVSSGGVTHKYVIPVKDKKPTHIDLNASPERPILNLAADFATPGDKFRHVNHFFHITKAIIGGCLMIGGIDKGLHMNDKIPFDPFQRVKPLYESIGWSLTMTSTGFGLILSTGAYFLNFINKQKQQNTLQNNI